MHHGGCLSNSYSTLCTFLLLLGREKGAKVPSTWVHPVDEFKEIVVNPGTPEFQTVEENFKRTIGNATINVLEVCGNRNRLRSSISGWNWEGS